MPYPHPFLYQIKRDTPLLVVSCSQTKRDIGDDLARFIELYDGPMWRQIKASSFPRSNVAAISALHGFMEPGYAIRTYDLHMDEDRSRSLCHRGNHVALFAQSVREAGSAFVVGGELYRELALTALRVYPDLNGLISFATGSYLAMRKQLGQWLRDQDYGRLA